MSDASRFVRREIRAASDRMRGTVVSQPTQKFFRPTQSAAYTWVVDVDVGNTGEVLLRDVPVKISAGTRFYARLGNAVFLERDARGRWQVIGPADRVQAQGNVTELDESDDSSTAAGQQGFTIVRPPFEFYEGDQAQAPGTSLWNNGVDAFPKVRILNGAGQEV